MAKRNRETKTAQVINLETTELFQSLSDEQAETVKGGGSTFVGETDTRIFARCNRTMRLMIIDK